MKYHPPAVSIKVTFTPPFPSAETKRFTTLPVYFKLLRIVLRLPLVLSREEFRELYETIKSHAGHIYFLLYASVV
jgi:hypothetical protein